MRDVKGRKASTKASTAGHDGKGGHWLEKAMGVRHNASNAPDLFGYEMKNHTNVKTTFGDWSADFYIHKESKYGIGRDDFMRIFGRANPAKGGRLSWSGSPCPKISGYNDFGQRLRIDNRNNILAVYSYSEDKRPDKNRIVPKSMQVEELVIARWDADSIKKKLEDKFNKLGWFKCNKIKGVYTTISFGAPITFATWIDDVRRGVVYFDSGMHQGNSRNYSQWRAANGYWNNLVVETH